MKVELFPFQKAALANLRMMTARALGEYQSTHAAQVISFTAPTGAGKTIILSALIENIFFGDDKYPDQQDAIFVWLSDSPQLNEQSKQKIDLKADKISLGQCVTITEDSFDQEMLDDGHIYFLNTQKLGKSSNLTKSGDRNYTIWETLANTVYEKSNRLYFIIDEAHRGMQGRNAGRATTIMQKFLKGSIEDKITPMPVIIGMSATMERFNKLVEGTTSTVRKCAVTADEVRSSGLLKDRIVITYPEENAVGKEMAVLQAAADDWKQKWDHWNQYCQEQHYAYVNPVFVIQVLSKTGNKISDTDLDDCLQKIEERIGYRFGPGEVVHTFGDTSSSIQINGLDVRYEEPSNISDERKIKVVFFKENLSTGWDCPRAETMMSFRHAVDATYIAQLLGRMVRTPMQMHIQVDDVLNDVHLYLPYFDKNTVKQVVDALQSTEGGDIPTDVYGENMEERTFDTLTIRPRQEHKYPDSPFPGQMVLDQTENTNVQNVSENLLPYGSEGHLKRESRDTTNQVAKEETKGIQNTKLSFANMPEDEQSIPATKQGVPPSQYDQKKNFVQEIAPIESFDREAVVKFINDAGLLSYNVRNIQISNYLSSLFKMVHLLSQSGLCTAAVNDVNNDIVQMIHHYVEDLKKQWKYDDKALQVKQFELQAQIFDVFGESLDNHSVHDLFTTTDTDIDRQFRIAESKLGNNGVGNEYGRQYVDWNDPSAFKIDVILFTAEPDCMEKLNGYAERKFHELNDEYRRSIAAVASEKIHKRYDNIVSDGDVISKHNFRLPETIQVLLDNGGKECSDHLFVNEVTGTARIKLNAWEEGTLDEERQRDDFVCWIRNPSRGSWSLTIPYEYDGNMKSAYPDLLIVRKDDILGYVVDILEPHMPKFDDNLGKAKGFAEYARQNPGIGRIQLIRMGKDATGKEHFKRLDMSKSAIRDKVSNAMNQDELNHLFDEYGFYE